MARFQFTFPILLAVNTTFMSGHVWGRDDADRLLDIYREAEAKAISEILPESDQALFASLAKIPLLSFIKPMNVLDWSARKGISDRTREILEEELWRRSQQQAGQSKAATETLRQAQDHGRELAGQAQTVDARLQRFKQYLLDNRIMTRHADGTPALTLYQASVILEQHGVDPYGFDAYPYYCALGISHIESIGANITRFCS